MLRITINLVCGILRDPAEGWIPTMAQGEFNHLLSSIAALSPEQMRRLRDELDDKLAASVSADADERAVTENEAEDQEVQRRLFSAGLLSEVKPPIRDLTRMALVFRIKGSASIACAPARGAR